MITMFVVTPCSYKYSSYGYKSPCSILACFLEGRGGVKDVERREKDMDGIHITCIW